MNNADVIVELRRLIRDFTRLGDARRLWLAKRALHGLAEMVKAEKAADRSCLKVRKRLNAANVARDRLVKAAVMDRRLIIRFHIAFEAAYDEWNAFQKLVKAEGRTFAKYERIIAQITRSCDN